MQEEVGVRCEKKGGDEGMKEREGAQPVDARDFQHFEEIDVGPGGCEGRHGG